MQQKIITMTQLALYDKHNGAADQNANDYFRHDYIYRKNLGTRFAVGFGGFIMLVLYWARNFLIEGADFFELDFATHFTDSILFILAILALYSLIGTVQGTREYYLVQKRLTRYLALVRQLERINERTQRQGDVKPREDGAENEDIPPDEPAPRDHTRRLAPLEPRPIRARPMATDEETDNLSDDTSDDISNEATDNDDPAFLVYDPNPSAAYPPPETRRSEPTPDGTDTDRA